MKKFLTVFFTGLTLISLMACAAQKASTDKSGALASRIVTVEATVEVINYKSRMLTLRGPQG